MPPTLENMLGPRVPRSELRRNWKRYLLPTALLLIAGGLLLASYPMPYWKMTLHAPQYPKGLHVQASLGHLSGDVREIDGLNHYIGMRPLNDAAQFERQTSAMMIGVLALLLVGAAFIHSRWAALLVLPALLFPAGFLADLQYWLANFGTNLNPHAALSSSIKPFVPPVLGVGTIGQFKTVADPAEGFWLAVAASGVLLVALWFHRRAYRPLFLKRRAGRATQLAPAMCAAGLILLAASTARAAGEARESNLNELIASAPAGSTLVVPAGTYGAPVAIDKPLTLIAQPGAVIDGRGVGEIVRITAPDVTLRRFAIRNSGISLDQQHAGIILTAPRGTIEENTLEDVLVGISLSGASESRIVNNRITGKNLDLPRRGDAIRLWNSNDALVEGNVVSGARDLVVWYSRGVRLIRNEVRDSRYGLHFMYANDGVVEENTLSENSVGTFLMYSRNVLLRGNTFDHNRGPSGYGIGLKDMDGVRVEGNFIVGNRVGAYIDNSPSRLDETQEFRRNVFGYNDVGVAFLPAVQRNQFVENEFRENIEQVAILGSGELKNNQFSLAGRGNFWSDYAGFDANGDGIGDVQYRAMSLFENLMDREPQMRLFIYSPAQQAIELASRAFPIVRPTPKIVDESPLMQPLPAAPATAQPRHSAALSWVGGGLLGVCALVTSSLRRRRVEVQSAGSSSAAATQSPAPQPAGSGNAVLTLSALRKTFGRFVAVDDVTLQIAPGSAVALWGTNGAGKTTIIKCILGLHRYRGEIVLNGHDCRRRGKAARRMLGYVSQEHAFYDDMSAIDTARFFARLKRVALSRANETLAEVGLTEHARKRVGELSGGMKQRLALAIALLSDPPVLLLDEPTSNLDAAARQQFIELLLVLKRAGKTLLFSTHRSEEIAALADRVIVLERGRIVRDVPAAELDPAAWLRLPLATQDHERAAELLVRAGFDAQRNCRAILVRVPPLRKAEPIAVLARAGIPVENFDLETGDVR